MSCPLRYEVVLVSEYPHPRLGVLPGQIVWQRYDDGVHSAAESASPDGRLWFDGHTAVVPVLIGGLIRVLAVVAVEPSRSPEFNGTILVADATICDEMPEEGNLPYTEWLKPE